MYENADQEALVIIDGSPGIGCPVIASITGADMVLMVAEPSLSGMSDLIRVVKTARIFKARIAVCVNKWDLNEKITRDIELFCREEGIDYLGKIPYDQKVVWELNRGKTVAEAKDGIANKAIREVFLKTIQII